MESLDGKIKDPCTLSFEQLSGLSDRDLLQHIRSRHIEALAELFARYHRLILSVANKILRDPTEAEDVTQSVFLEICRVANQFDPSRGSVKVWLLQYAYHRSLDRRQYLRVRGFYDRTLREPDPSNFAAGFSADALMTQPEAHRLVREGLDSLNSPQRMVLYMAYFQDMPLKDIAEATGDSLGNVRHHYYRGLNRLRSLLLARNGNGSKRPTNKAKYEIADRGPIDVEAEIT
jgi:RNA polymerase sigma-70 factor (ECF subfamily)